MENWFTLYLITRLDGVNGALSAFTAIGGMGAALLGIFGGLMKMDGGPFDEEASTKTLGWAKRFFIACLVGAAGLIFIPTKNDVFFIVGGSALIEAAKTDTAKRIGSKSLEAVETWLDENMPKKAEPPK